MTADTRTRIVKAACKLLRKDPGSVRMEDVAQAARVSRQAVYLHFPNRTALLEAATAHIETELDFHARTIPIREAKSGVIALDRMAEFLGDYLPAVQSIIDAFTMRRSSDAAVQDIFKSRSDDRRGGVKQVVAWLVRDKTLAKDLDAATAEELLMGLTSYELWREMVVVGKLSNAEYVVQIKRLFRRAVL